MPRCVALRRHIRLKIFSLSKLNEGAPRSAQGVVYLPFPTYQDNP